jgi:hypothetical protein
MRSRPTVRRTTCPCWSWPAGAILWALAVFFFCAGLVRHGLNGSAIASPQMANQVLRGYEPEMYSRAAMMLVEQRALEALDVSAWAT